MCFLVNEDAQRPQCIKAFKVVELTWNGYLKSLSYRTSYSYPGYAVRCNGTQYTINSINFAKNGKRYANHGIYVYLDQRTAERALGKIKYNRVILRVIVDPADWLVSSKKSLNSLLMATYKKVIIDEDQPYLEWY